MAVRVPLFRSGDFFLARSAAAAQADDDVCAERLWPIWLLLILAVLLFGASWPLVKLAVVSGGASPLWLAASRSGLACLTLFGVLAARGEIRRPMPIDRPALLATGVLQLSAFFLLGHLAVRAVPASHTAILSNSALIFVAPLAALFGERQPIGQWAAAIVVLLGVGLVLGPWSIDCSDPGLLVAYGCLLLAAFLWACTIVTIRMRPPALPAFGLLPWAFAVSFVILAGTAAVLEPAGRLPPGSWLAAGFNGVLVAPLGTYCLFELSRRLSPMRSSVAFMVIPVVGMLISVLLLGETVTLQVAAGNGLITAGALLAARRRA